MTKPTTTTNGSSPAAKKTTPDDAAPEKKSASAESFEYEFGGPIGTTLNIVLLPILVLLLGHWAKVGFIDLQGIGPDVLCPSCQNNNAVLLLQCTGGVVAWFAFQVLLERWLPCELVEGTEITDKSKSSKFRLTYRINGHLAFWVTWLVACFGYPQWHEESQSIQFTAFPLEQWIYPHFGELAFVTSLLTLGLSLYLYLDSFVGDKVLAAGGNSGVVPYDLFVGRELNPRPPAWLLPNFDWKEFCELRPGLLAWMLINLANLRLQYQELGYVTGSMLLVNLFQGLYVWDGLYQERAILTTMDITTDGFGYMLVFGDLCWVPFTYSLQSRYLVYHDPHLSATALAGIVLLHILGYFIFRSANGQKDAFRRNPADPALAHLAFLQTRRGTKLLTSGWWGWARKINYTGDWIMGLTWCLTCGFGSIVPYFYAVYFAILLVHRSERDDQLCQAKYGDDWNTYKKLVPYRFVPGIV